MSQNRMSCLMLETPVPQAIADEGKAAEFLRSAHKVIEDFFGTENVGGTCGHFDEQHWYIDKDGKERLSLIHGHTIIAAYAEWTDQKTGEQRKGINGKHCETKARLKALNKAMDDMCCREYGLSYNTAETPQRKSVERLKQETELRREADMQRRRIAELEQQAAKKEKELDHTTEKLSKTLNYLPKKSSEDLSDRSDEIISEFNEIKSPIIQKSTAEKYIKAVEKQKNIAIDELDKAERAIYSLRKVNSDAQKTNEKLQDDNKRLRAENIDLQQKLSVARRRENAIQRLGLGDVISAEVDRSDQEEKSRQKEKKHSRQDDLSF